MKITISRLFYVLVLHSKRSSMNTMRLLKKGVVKMMYFSSKL